MSDNALIDRDIRQRDLVPPAKLAKCCAIVVGVGAIGRQVALQLAALGVPELVMIDHDTVGVENLAVQGYWPQDLDIMKVIATERACKLINPEVIIDAQFDRFRRSSAKQLGNPSLDRVLFCCVDSMEVRRSVWESMRNRLALFIDGRMNAEVIRVLVAESPWADSHYQTTLFSDRQAVSGSCTGRSTIYTASIAAGLMVGQFTRWLRKLPCEADLVLNLLASEITTSVIPEYSA